MTNYRRKVDTNPMTEKDHTRVDAMGESADSPTASSNEAEVCITAAIRLPDGTVVQGRRHHECMQNASEQGHQQAAIQRAEQGFVTSTGRFVDRRIGRCIQEMAGVPSAALGGYRYDILFSEDLY